MKEEHKRKPANKGWKPEPNLGQWGEQLVAQSYEVKGYTIIERNFRTRYGEIDLIASNETSLVFIEVKTRRSKKFGEGFEAVDFRKQEKLTITAELYMVTNPSELQPRFDVVSVYASRGLETKEPVIEVLENAF